MSTAKELDQFYTRPEVASWAVRELKSLFPTLGYNDPVFVEPSAGTGAFLKALGKNDKWIAGDLEPHYPGVLERNFLEDELPVAERDSAVIFGNPPFGKKSKLALAFVERSFDYSDTVAFILPVQFRKYITQKQIKSTAKLVYDELCPENSFVFNGKDYDVRCCFQVWTLRETELPDLRTRTAPPTKHVDFTTWTYNATEGAEFVFSEDWEFAVRRQGWGDFTPLHREDDPELSRKIQWMLFKPHTEKARENLLSIDYEELAKKNTSVRGFGKADLVEEYMTLFGRPEVSGGLFRQES